MRILEQLWNDRVSSNRLKRTPAEEALNNKILKKQEKLTPMLSPEAKEIFEELMDCQGELASMNDCEIFIDGLRLGARLIQELNE